MAPPRDARTVRRRLLTAVAVALGAVAVTCVAAGFSLVTGTGGTTYTFEECPAAADGSFDGCGPSSTFSLSFPAALFAVGAVVFAVAAPTLVGRRRGLAADVCSQVAVWFAVLTAAGAAVVGFGVAPAIGPFGFDVGRWLGVALPGLAVVVSGGVPWAYYGRGAARG